MAHPITVTITILTGGVFSQGVDMDKLKTTVLELAPCSDDCDITSENIELCLSKELEANKGSVVVIAGVFNYWGIHKVAVYAQELSRAFDTDVTVITHNHATDGIDVAAFSQGHPMNKSTEDFVSKIIRGTSG